VVGLGSAGQAVLAPLSIIQHSLSGLLGVSRAKASNHLACLRGCGLVTATREGRQVRYELADQRLAGALRELARVVLDSPACPAHLNPRP
jgi:DNA-binding transcriptional ArsR family regulator